MEELDKELNIINSIKDKVLDNIEVLNLEKNHLVKIHQRNMKKITQNLWFQLINMMLN